ncbi:transcriptional regulator, ArsR family [Bryocella elongata]|uniref:Transcriptional regulator, ArsR family n=1 Tax=Bryocella elongata TaxID=863522 RepID=A0A1H6BRB3_9BACT|nr:metalloregulator ArsR/SmtB family transcription factor [Bryocella elongata]SEG62756.1 transcriptional regulator, ArsR family [Bryocella elongata]
MQSDNPQPVQQAEIFRALGDPTRLGLLSRLTSGEASISELSEGAKMTRQAVTKHLRVLERAGLVHAERLGRECVYRIDPRPLDHGRAFFEQFSGHWERALSRLKAMVESIPE